MKSPAHNSASTHDDTLTRPRESDGMLKWWKSLFVRKDPSLKEVLEEAIEEHEEQAEESLAPEEKAILHNVLSFRDSKASDIMAQRADIAAVPHDITLAALKARIIEQRHTRIPVYKETLDKVLGFLHIKDLLPMLGGDAPFNLESLLHPVLFVPPSMRTIDVLIRMRQAGRHMAIVVDEYGGTDGLITMENLFEEIVGDIEDEHERKDEPVDRILRVGPNAFEADARIPIEKLEEQLSLKLVSEDQQGEFDTLGGLIFSQLGRVPARGEVMTHASGVRFEIIQADPRRIRRVRIIGK